LFGKIRMMGRFSFKQRRIERLALTVFARPMGIGTVRRECALSKSSAHVCGSGAANRPAKGADRGGFTDAQEAGDAMSITRTVCWF